MPSPPPLNGRVVPSNRRLAVAVAVTAVAVAALWLLALPASAQQAPEQVPTTGFSPMVDAIVGGFVTLLVGGGLIALAPEFTERTTDRVLEEPGRTFLYGLGIAIATIVVVVLLAITIVGLLLVVPIVIALVVLGTLGYLASGRAVTDEWGSVLLVAVAVSALANAVPLLGGLVGFVLSSMGIGAWYLDYRDDGSSSGGGSDLGSADSGGSGGSTTGGDVNDEWGATQRTSGGADSTSGTGGDATGPDPDTDVDTGSADDAGDEWTAGFDDADRE